MKPLTALAIKVLLDWLETLCFGIIFQLLPHRFAHSPSPKISNRLCVSPQARPLWSWVLIVAHPEPGFEYLASERRSAISSTYGTLTEAALILILYFNQVHDSSTSKGAGLDGLVNGT